MPRGPCDAGGTGTAPRGMRSLRPTPRGEKKHPLLLIPLTSPGLVGQGHQALLCVRAGPCVPSSVQPSVRGWVGASEWVRANVEQLAAAGLSTRVPFQQRNGSASFKPGNSARLFWDYVRAKASLGELCE